VRRLRGLGHRYDKKIKIGAGFLLMYAGFVLLLLPMIISAWPLPSTLTLSSTPISFGFEDDLSSVHSTHGNPMVVTSPLANGKKVVECRNGDYVRWNLGSPSKTIDLTFKVYWTRLPRVTNESLSFGQILGLGSRGWQGLLTARFYCDSNGYRGGALWTDMPSGRGDFVSDDVVYALETDRWYAVRMTVDLNVGAYRLYLDGDEVASIGDVEVPEDVYVDFFRLCVDARGKGAFATYFDDVAVSLLDSAPPPERWSLRVTCSAGGSADSVGLIGLGDGEDLTVNALPASGYVFGGWVFDGVDFGTGSAVTVPAQSVGSRHTLHAAFIGTVPASHSEYSWVPLQVIGLFMVGGGGYLLWSVSKVKPRVLFRALILLSE
jgi:hypothetical protein